jgi:hypothetical protein
MDNICCKEIQINFTKADIQVRHKTRETEYTMLSNTRYAYRGRMKIMINSALKSWCSQMHWYTPIIPALGRVKAEASRVLDSQSSTANSRPAWAT